MPNPDPYVYLEKIAAKMRDPEALKDRKEVEILLDEVEYLYDLIEPEMQDGMEQVMAQLHNRLAELS